MKYDPNAWQKLGDKFTNNYEAGMLDYRAHIISTVIRYQPDCKNILEIACADGWFIEQMRKHRMTLEYGGIDITQNLIYRAKKRMPRETFATMDATDLNIILNQDFDFVLCAGLLMHLPHYQKAMSEAFRVSNKYVMFSTYGTYERKGYAVDDTKTNFINNVYTFSDIMRFVPVEFKLIEFNAFQRTSNFNVFQYLFIKRDLP